MQHLKAYLFMNGVGSPMKMISVTAPDDATDKEIAVASIEEFKNMFRVELEDRVHQIEPEKVEVEVDPSKNQIIKQVSKTKIKVDGETYKKADIIHKHGMTEVQWNYLRSIKKHSMVEIYLDGKDLYTRKKKMPKSEDE